MFGFVFVAVPWPYYCLCRPQPLSTIMYFWADLCSTSRNRGYSNRYTFHHLVCFWMSSCSHTPCTFHCHQPSRIWSHCLLHVTMRWHYVAQLVAGYSFPFAVVNPTHSAMQNISQGDVELLCASRMLYILKNAEDFVLTTILGSYLLVYTNILRKLPSI